MMKPDFNTIIDLVFAHEGGFSDYGDDPRTNMGITQETFDAFTGGGVDVKGITREAAERIYKKQYWDRVWADDLPSGVNYAVFDFAVNSGVSRAVKFLQRVVGTKADGIMGQKTLNAVHSLTPEILILRLSDARRDFVRSLSKYKRYGRGWERRITEVEDNSIAMSRRIRPVLCEEEPAPKADGEKTVTSVVKGGFKDPKASIVTATTAATSLLQFDDPWIKGLVVGAGILIVAACVFLFVREQVQDD